MTPKLKSLLRETGLAYDDGHLASLASSLPLESHLFKKMKVQSNTCGKNVIADEPIARGQKVLQFSGEIKTFDKYPFAERPYLIPIGDFQWLNPVGLPRFVNHSCDPNCALQNRIELVALRDIKAGEEITFRYDIVSYSSDEGSADFLDQCRWDHAFTFVCLCQSQNCSGVIDRNLIFHKVGANRAERKPISKKKKIVA